MSSGLTTCKRIMDSLPSRFNYKQLTTAIKMEAGFDTRTVSKYTKILCGELKWIIIMSDGFKKKEEI